MRPQAFPSALQLTDGPPPLAPRSLHPPHPSVLPSPSFPPLFPVIPPFKPGAGSAQAGIHATSSLPSALQLTDAPPHSRHVPFTRPTPRSCPLFRHSCAGRNPCDLKLPVSAPANRRPPHHSRHAPFTHPIPRSCPSFPSFLRRQESMRPQASRQRPRSATARRHSRRFPFVHPRSSLIPSLWTAATVSIPRSAS